KILVEDMLLALVQDLNRSAHRANYAAPNDSLRQLQVVEAEDLDTLIEIEHALGDVVQAKIFPVLAIEFIHAEVGMLELLVEGDPDARRDVQQGEEARRVQAAAMSQAGADHVIVVRSNGFEHVQERDRIINHCVGAAHQAGSVRVIAFLDVSASTLE